MIDIFSNHLNKQIFKVSSNIKIYRDEEATIIEKINSNDNSITENEDKIKLGEIIIKDSKYFYKPNLKESFYPDLNTTTSDSNPENYSWLIYKGERIPINKNKYRIKEGDVIKLGREWLFIREIYISNATKKKLKIKNREILKGGIKKIFSCHSLANKEFNIQEDFIIMENNDTEEDKDEEINEKKFVTENEETSRNLKQIVIKDNIKYELLLKDKVIKEKKDKNIDVNNTNKKTKICRICYIEEYDKINNPLIKPCKCSGSMKYIHYDCLLRWIKTKIIDKKDTFYTNDFSSVYSLGIIECELCKSKLPDYIRHKNEIYSLLNFDKKFDEDINLNYKGEKNNKRRKENKNSYVIFDLINPTKTENRFRFFVKFNENNIIRIGRGLENQLVLNDISVSRNHCQLRINNDGSILLEDNHSKFGSLVLIQKEIEILKGQNLNVQVSTNYLTFSLKKRENFFSCCNAEEIDEKNNYEKLNSLSIKYNKYDGILNESITPENSDKEEENEPEIQQDKEIDFKNGMGMVDKKEDDNKSDDLIIFNTEKRKRNKRHIENSNFDSIYNGSTLMLKENQSKERINLGTNNINNIKIIRQGIKDMNKNIIDDIKSENIIISEGEENKSNKEK